MCQENCNCGCCRELTVQRGEKGATGATGATGAAGTNGTNGTAGTNGKMKTDVTLSTQGLPGISNNNTTSTTVLTSFIYDGSAVVGTITAAKIIASMSVLTNPGIVVLYDYTNSKIIGTVSNVNSLTPTIYTATLIAANVPTAEAIIEVRAYLSLTEPAAIIYVQAVTLLHP